MKRSNNKVSFCYGMIAVFLTGVMMISTVMVSKSLAADMTTESPTLSSQKETPASTAASGPEADDSEYLADEEAGAPPPVRVADPLEPWNRAMFVFNDKCYFWVLKPVAQGYRTVISEPLRLGIKNFFYNLGMPVRVVNCVLQGKGKEATGEGVRFLYNTTLGFLGFGNPAANHSFLNPDSEDFGQTLGRYGIGHGVYIVWPLLGPSSIRDTVGFGGDYFLTPTTYVEPMTARVGISAGERVNQVSLQIGDYETFKAAALEPYASARDAYLQYRKRKVEK